jgi:hypothetical protein
MQPDKAVSAGGDLSDDNHCMRATDTNRRIADMPNQRSDDLDQIEALNCFDGRGGMPYSKFFQFGCRYGRSPFDLLTEEVNGDDNRLLAGYRRFWDSRFQRLDALLNELKARS